MPQHEGIGFLMKASKQRLYDAKALLATSKPERERGALYLCGYSIECMLKAALVSRSPNRATTLTDAEANYRAGNPRFPSLTSAGAHDLALLFGLCEVEARVPFTHRERQWFGTVRKWSHTWRYLADRPRPGVAADFISAAESIVNSVQRYC